MEFRRLQRQVTLPVRLGDVPTAVATIRDRRQEAYRAERLRCSVTDDGALRVWAFARGRYLTPTPVLRGTLAPRRRGVEFQGTVTESMITLWLGRAFTVVAGLLFFGAIGLMAAQGPGTGWATLALLGAWLPAAVGRRIERSRSRRFDVEAAAIVRLARAQLLRPTAAESRAGAKPVA